MAVHPANDTGQSPAVPRDWLLALDEIEGVDLPRVGGKAYRLAVLKQRGLNVPPGLVLTTRFFEAHLKYTKLTPLWAGSPDVAVTAEALSWLADALKTRPLARPLAAALDARLNELFGSGAGSFAVRSSVIDEDQRDHSFAGIHLTELGVPRGAMPIAISRCWASALSGAAIEYRQVHGMSIQTIQIALLIQPMLSPECSGVGFTLNPLTGARTELVIEATPGLGSVLVSGEIQPHLFRLANQPPDYPLLQEQPGAKTVTLAAVDLAQLAQRLNQVEALMGEPQDIEWAKQGSEFSILQTRPVVAARPAAPPVDRVWSRANYPDYLPELPTPYFGSMLERAQPQLLQAFTDIGFDASQLGPYERLIFGRPYLNLTLLKRLASRMGLNPERLFQSIGYAQASAGVRAGGINWRNVWQSRRIYHRVYRQTQSLERNFQQVRLQVTEIAAKLAVVPANPSPDILLYQLRQQEELYALINRFNLSVEMGVTFVAGIIGAITGQSAAGVIALAAPRVSNEFRRSLAELGQLAQKNDKLQAYLLDPAQDFADYAAQLAGFPEFWAQFRVVCARLAEHALFAADPGCPRFSEEPQLLLKVIWPFVAPIVGKNAVKNDVVTPPEWKNQLIGPLLHTLDALLAMQSQLDAVRTIAMSACRRWALAVAQIWAAENWLPQPQDVFWLTFDEIERLLVGGAATAVTLPATVQARKDTHNLYASTSIPFNVTEAELMLLQLGESLPAGSLPEVIVGLPVSPGQARGRVVVITQPNQLPPLSHDTILVLPSTGPNWLPLLHLAVGLIVETGGLLSHGSVIAREYGIPAVANIPQATHRFKTGDRVLVDGSTGVIQPL